MTNDEQTTNGGQQRSLSRLERLKLEKDFQAFNYAQQGAKTAQQIRQIEEETQSRIYSIVESLIKVCDSFQKLRQAGDPQELSADDLLHRVESYQVVGKQVAQVLNAIGVEEFVPLGEPFNELEHEAFNVIADPELGPAGTIVQVIESGYRWKESLVRPARVVVVTPE